MYIWKRLDNNKVRKKIKQLFNTPKNGHLTHVNSKTLH
jgi:hypothetical protein